MFAGRACRARSAGSDGDEGIDALKGRVRPMGGGYRVLGQQVKDSANCGCFVAKERAGAVASTALACSLGNAAALHHRRVKGEQLAVGDEREALIRGRVLSFDFGHYGSEVYRCCDCKWTASGIAEFDHPGISRSRKEVLG